jgi:hypothetical protein
MEKNRDPGSASRIRNTANPVKIWNYLSVILLTLPSLKIGTDLERFELLDPDLETSIRIHINDMSLLWVCPHRPDRHPEGTDSNLDKMHVC